MLSLPCQGRARKSLQGSARSRSVWPNESDWGLAYNMHLDKSTSAGMERDYPTKSRVKRSCSLCESCELHRMRKSTTAWKAGIQHSPCCGNEPAVYTIHCSWNDFVSMQGTCSRNLASQPYGKQCWPPNPADALVSRSHVWMRSCERLLTSLI